VTVELLISVRHNGSHPDVALAAITTVGNGSTVTVTVAVAAGEHPSFAVTVYVVVTAGETESGVPVPAGAHVYVYGPPAPNEASAAMLADAPGQMETAPLATTVSGGFTVTVTFTAAAGHPLASVALTVYSVVATGLTETVAVVPVPAGDQI
jgi:hypothetical protein